MLPVEATSFICAFYLTAAVKESCFRSQHPCFLVLCSLKGRLILILILSALWLQPTQTQEKDRTAEMRLIHRRCNFCCVI